MKKTVLKMSRSIYLKNCLKIEGAIHGPNKLYQTLNALNVVFTGV